MRNLTIPLLLALVMFTGYTTAFAQKPEPDTTAVRLYKADTIIVSVKSVGKLENQPAAVTVLNREELNRTPATNVAGALSGIEGLHVYDFNGDGTNQTVELRGFTGTGLTSYVRLLVDGVPVNEMEDDNVDWNMIAPQEVQRIEVVRGPTSTLYGNVGMSGLVNIVTRSGAPGLHARVSTLAGSQSALGAIATIGYGAPGMDLSITARNQKTDGWRNNSGWKGNRLNGKARFTFGEGSELGPTLLGVHGWLYDTKREEPGAVTEFQPRESSVNDVDRLDEQKWQGGASFTTPLTTSTLLEVYGTVHGKDVHQIETIAFQTQDNDRSVVVASGESRVRSSGNIDEERGWEVLVGVEAERGTLESQYYAYNTGQGGERGEQLTDGTTTRTALGSYATGRIDLLPEVAVSTGVRYDAMNGTFENVDGETKSTDMTAGTFSGALQWRFTEGSFVYGSVSRSFKAPTLEQLYDERSFFIDPSFPPLTLSSSTLQPQRAWNYEVGSRASIINEISVSAALYYLHVTNEIGFDLANFKYANIAESIHRGAELSVKTQIIPELQHTLNYTHSAATFSGGSYDGNQINAVPKNIIATGLQWSGLYGEFAGVELRHIRDQYLDESNMIPLDNYTVLDLRLGYSFRNFTVDITTNNLLDEQYSATGYVSQDQFGNPIPLYFPANSRTFTGRITAEF